MRVVSVIPVKGRHPLLRYTIERLYQKNGVSHVLCVGDEADREVCEERGAEFLVHENNPLGKKWNAGFQAVRKYQPDAVLYVGSSDWVSDNWLSFIEPYIQQGFSLVGKPDFHLMDVGETIRMAYWRGYAGQREGEPIGIGRVITADALNRINWTPFSDTANNGMDLTMYHRVLNTGGKVRLLKTGEIQSLSISSSHWSNLHKFEQHTRIPCDPHWLAKHFPEYVKI